MSRYTVSILSILAMAFPIASHAAASLTLTNTYQLSGALEFPSSNFHPQGIGFDASANELLFIQQSAKNIVRTDLAGNVLGSRSLGNFNHTVSVAADANNYYFTDYTANTYGKDLYSIGKSSGVATALSSETAAYGGYPIDVRNGLLYRTNVTGTYNNNALHQIRVSAIGTPDTVIRTLTLAGAAGIADFAVDLEHNSIWGLDYSASTSIRRFDLDTGALLDTFALGLDGLDAGLTYGNNTLYYYDWINGNSTLRSYSVGGIAAPIPEPETYAMMLAGLGMVGFMVRRRKSKQT